MKNQIKKKTMNKEKLLRVNFVIQVVLTAVSQIVKIVKQTKKKGRGPLPTSPKGAESDPKTKKEYEETDEEG